MDETLTYLSVDLGEETESSPEHEAYNALAYAAQRRAGKREQRDRDRLLQATGLWPGYWWTYEEQPGRHVAVVSVSTGVAHRYLQRESVARFDSADDAEHAARLWLRRLTSPR